jgi:SAM-dependent methyltransferase
MSLSRPNYGVDAPQIVLRFVFIALVTVALAALIRIIFGSASPELASGVFQAGATTAFFLLATAGIMVLGSKVFKPRMRERFLDRLRLSGEEQVLDVGCGRGLLLNAAARRLTTGKATGVDLWQTEDQSGNHPDRTLENARAEGVEAKIDIKTADMRKMPFEANTFDVVVSSWAIHNIANKEGRAEALAEIVRVLKPGGKLAIIDIQHTAKYAEELARAGMRNVRRSRPNFLFLIPSRTVTADKPRA